jgi:CDP-paratose 2-epimerase
MKILVVTGSGGLIGSQTVKYFSSSFDLVIGIDNDSRSYFFGNEASTSASTSKLKNDFKNFKSLNVDIRDKEEIFNIFSRYNNDIKLVVHTAAQPSHDWAAKEPFTDFTINANGTLNLLEATRIYSSDAVFIFTSTNKVYGDSPNNLPLIEEDTRWEIDRSHPYYLNGINEQLSVDQSKHSLFGASKLSADILVQEYGKYFNIKTGIFRGGCLTGPNHAAAELHGFLAYLMKCCINNKEYTIFGYKGKQVRDNIHSLDLISMFEEFYLNPKYGEVYNAGGGRFSNCSMKEAIKMCEIITSNKMKINYSETNRIGDHIWYISDQSKFKKDYPNWKQKYSIQDILLEMFNSQI